VILCRPETPQFPAVLHRSARIADRTWMQTPLKLARLSVDRIEGVVGTWRPSELLPMLVLSCGRLRGRPASQADSSFFYTQIAMMITASSLPRWWGVATFKRGIFSCCGAGRLAMAFDMPHDSIHGRNDQSRNLMNAVSLNSSIVNGARVVGPCGGLAHGSLASLVFHPERRQLHCGHRGL